MAGQGTSPQAHAYEFRAADLDRYGGSQVYYRLRQVDTDCMASYSPVRTVTLVGGGLSLFPNPTRGAATLSGAASVAAVQVLDAVGQVVLRATADVAGEAPLAGLPPGAHGFACACCNDGWLLPRCRPLFALQQWPLALKAASCLSLSAVVVAASSWC